MNTVEILKNLKPYSFLINELFKHEQFYLQGKDNFVKLKKDISIEYDFINLQLTGMYKTEGEGNEIQNRLYGRVCFESPNNTYDLKDIYCEDASRMDELKIIINNTSLIEAAFDYKEEIYQYLQIADSIAKRTQNCTSGDNYRPGYYSKIFVSDEQIILSQVNYMNAKSLNHKNDYSMRNLEIIIPLSGQKENMGFSDYQIGVMLIRFSDSSSDNNRSCGLAIREQIELESALYNAK
jgi:hypothetical protein